MKKSPRERVLERALEMACDYIWTNSDAPNCREVECEHRNEIVADACKGNCEKALTAYFFRKATKEAKGETK